VNRERNTPACRMVRDPGHQAVKCFAPVPRRQSRSHKSASQAILV
jgi:hypothetical protein